MKFLQKLIEIAIRKHRQLRRFYRMVFAMACVVVFVTSYALMLPAITLEKDAAATMAGIETGGEPEAEDRSEPEEAPEDDGTEEEPAQDSDQSEEPAEENRDETPADDVTEEPADSVQVNTDDAKTAEELTDDTGSAENRNEDADSAQDDSGNGETASEGGTEDKPAAEEPAQTAEEDELITEETVLQARGSDFDVYVTVTAETKLFKGTTLQVREITEKGDEEEYRQYLEKAQEELREKYDDNTRVSFARFYDISFLYKGVKTEPAGDVTVRFEFDKPVEMDAGKGVDTVHFDEEKDEKPEFIEADLKTDDGRCIRTGAGNDTADTDTADDPSVRINEVEFTSSSFSVYGVVGTTIEKTVLASDGRNYKITVTYGSDAEIPSGTELSVTEIAQEEGACDEATAYEIYSQKAGEALGLETEVFDYARFFDISLVKDGEKVQPREGSEVNVKIELADTDSASLKVLHFAGEEGADNSNSSEGSGAKYASGAVSVPELVDGNTEPGEVDFATGGFSVYAIVDAPEPVPSGWSKVSTVDQIAELGAQGFYLCNPAGYYFTNQMYSPTSGRTGIKKTKPASSTTDAAIEKGAVKYYFEPSGNSGNKFKAYCLDNDGNKLYVRQSGNSLSLTTAASASIFTIDGFPGEGETFRVLGSGGYYWNMQGGEAGGGFAAYNNPTDINARIQMEYYTESPDDPYGLNGKTFGIAYHNDSALSAALMAEQKTVNNKERLAGLSMVMRPDVVNSDGILLVSEGSDISEWKFELVAKDQYYITTNVNGSKKYLTITNDQVTLTDAPDPVNSVIKATPGTEENSGKWHFSVGRYSLNLAGSASNGFNAATGNGATTWMNLVEKSTLTDDDFTLYTAQKVSVSDTLNVYDGQQIVLYTRIWNETKKKYEFFAVDHDGTLIPCYDTGDNIEWIGSKVNTALWDFSEYRNPDGTLNYYYELQNAQYGDYIAPQVSGGQILSDSTIGLNMNGRRYGENYTKIVAWDDDKYAYVGLKAEDGHVVACPLKEADDFYFAIINPVDPQDELTKVATVDSKQYGIEMKMIDFNNALVDNRDSVQTEFFGYDSNTPGLLKNSLDGNDYPETADGRSLSELFNNMTEVNHLFIQSVYNESGYFEYNSTANFAHLNSDGNFTVYDQIAAIGTSTKPTRTHGQFMPYNDIVAGKYAVVTNQTDVLQNPLSDLDPRKGEKLYLIGQNEADYFFGMEMSASFTQTANGLDAWGHDIIFEFSGDDDFWFYVDDELVLDLGGVHPAMTGSINFRTGEVVSSRGDSTSLYEIFKSNYQARGLSEDEIAQKLDEIFKTNENGQHVFKDYTKHTMRMFYMERGAGASNLHMRFNLAAVKPGSVVLSKKLSGAESADNKVIEFPYQIYYKTRSDYGDTNYYLLEEKTGDKYNVTYNNTTTPVTFKDTFTPAGGTASYDNVFFLKPGESALIELPEDTIDYYIVECAVNTNVFDDVTVNAGDNEEKPTRLTTANPDRCDFQTSTATTDDRPQVDFDNHVKEGAMRTLSINKMLYDVDGFNRLHYPEDPTLFTFRLYLGSENDTEIPLADMYKYHVKDPDGNYCRYDDTNKRFASLSKTEYSALTDEEKEAATFVTSIYGTISKIPADYTVEVHDLIIGTQYKVEERIKEIPKGYTLRLQDGYMRTDTTPFQNNETTPITGTMQAGEDPQVRVSNQKGWGLTVEKVWTDKDFMESHDDIYFAVYLMEDGILSADPVPGTVRRLDTDSTEIYYFFGSLSNERPFEDYVVREVTLTEGPDFAIDDNNVVTGYEDLQPIEEGGNLTNGGTPVGGEHRDGYEYTVHYTPGEQTTLNENVRTDKVTNSIPGIEIFKKDLSGDVLAGAVFTLTDEEGQPVAASSYTSRSGDGLITIAYLSEGTYTLTETSAPKGFVALPSPVTITVAGDGSITVDGPEGLVELDEHPESGMTASITVKDRPTAFRVVKKGKAASASEQDVELEGVHFALYRQVKDNEGNLVKDYTPMPGYTDLVTDANGIVPKVTMNLAAGTYYLTETQTVEDYDLLTEDLCFTIGTDGTVTVRDAGHQSWLTEETDPETHHVAYVITIPNEKYKKVQFKKVDIASPQDSALSGAVFDLYRVVNGQRETDPMISGLTSGGNGYLVQGSNTVFQLPIGVYHLVETHAPDGYYLRSDPVVVTVTAQAAPRGVSYDDGTSVSQGGAGISFDEETGVYEMLISNSAGIALPASGGIGTGLFRILGLLLIAAAAAGLRMRAH